MQGTVMLESRGDQNHLNILLYVLFIKLILF